MAHNLVQRFGGEGSSALRVFDTMIDRVGLSVQTLKGRLGLILPAIELIVTAYKTLEPLLATVAQQTGAEREFEGLKSAVADLGAAAVEVATGSMPQLATETDTAARATSQFSNYAEEAEQKSRSWAAVLLGELRDGLQDVANGVRGLAPLQQQSWETLERTAASISSSIERQQRTIEVYKQRLQELPESERESTERVIAFHEQQIAAKRMNLFVTEQLIGANRMAAEGKWQSVTTVDTGAQNEFLSGLDREVRQLEAKTKALGMSTAAAADYLALENERLDLERRGIALGPEQQAQYDALIARRRGALQSQDAYNEALRLSRESEAGWARGTVVTENNALIKSMQQVNDVGRSVANSLTQQFRNFARGAEVDFKQMAGSMLADLAEIIFKASVIEPLLGATGKTGDGGGLITQALGSIFGGFREQGGPVEAGRAYVVGEKRPELFIPDRPGRIASDTGGPSGEVHVYVHASSEFDAKIESTAQGVVARSAPSIVGASVDATRRNMAGLMTETNRRKT